MSRKSNEIIKYNDYAEIILYNRRKEEVGRALIDLEDIELIKSYKWYLTSYGYAANGKLGLLHRFIMNPPEGYVVDHINHNRLDNRRCNLRICTIQQNSMNRGAQSNNKLGIKGVDIHGNKYRATIKFNGKKIYIGHFDTIEEAQEAYNKKANELFGEFSIENSEQVSKEMV